MTTFQPPSARRLPRDIVRRARAAMCVAAVVATVAAGAVVVTFAVTFAVTFVGAPGTALAGETEQKKSVETDCVFLGDARNWSKPAEVDQDAVFAEISEYKEIIDGKLEPSDVKYGVLMTKARKRFMCAVRAVAKDASYDLVAKVGSVKGVESVPVITRDVIAKL